MSMYRRPAHEAPKQLDRVSQSPASAEFIKKPANDEVPKDFEVVPGALLS